MNALHIIAWTLLFAIAGGGRVYDWLKHRHDKPEPDWKAIAGRLYGDLVLCRLYGKTPAMREYEEAVNERHR